MIEQPDEKPKPAKSLTPLLDSVTDPEPEDAQEAIEKKGEPDGGGNFA